MTVELHKTIDDAKKDMRHLKETFKVKRRKRGYFYPVIVSLIYDPRDGPGVGMRGFTFMAERAKKYYAIIDSLKDLPTFRKDVYSKVLRVVY